ncbi:HNH endonuclease [Thermoactinomyces mirandus]|nr:HNH endonuclease [Thermoactinomyces mirandus]
MLKQLYQFFLVLLMVFAGSIIWGNDIAHAGGSFDVPEVNDGFNQFDQAPPPQQEQPVNTMPVTEDKGFWDSVTEPFTKAWDWTTDKISDAMDWTTEKASAFWDWLTGVLSKITDVVVDALAATWDWTQKFKEYIAFAGVLILGIALCFFAPPLGVSVLTGMALSLVIGTGLNGWKFDKTVFLEAAIGGLLGLIGGGITGGASRAMASGFGKKLVTGVTNSKVLGPLARGGGKLISKLPKPMQQVFGKAGLIGSVEGAGTSIADDLLHGRKINWKKALLSGVAGAALVGAGAFIIPKVEPIVNKVTTAFQKAPVVQAAKRVDDCLPFAYQQQPVNYTALAMSPFAEFAKCISAPEPGVSSTKWLSNVEKQTIKEENIRKYGVESKSRKTYNPHKDAGKIVARKDGKKVLTYYDGRTRAILNSEHAGQKVSIDVNGSEYKVPFDNDGFPDFEEWTDYTSILNVDQYLLKDGSQFNLLSKRVAKDIQSDEKLRKNIDNTFLEVLEKGVGEDNGPAKDKLKKFLNNNSGISQNLTNEEINALLSGRGSASILAKLNNNPRLKREFLQANINWIDKGNTPVGYTWHHHQDEGKMQLVKTRVHGNIRHTGGRQIWAGGR